MNSSHAVVPALILIILAQVREAEIFGQQPDLTAPRLLTTLPGPVTGMVTCQNGAEFVIWAASENQLREFAVRRSEEGNIDLIPKRRVALPMTKVCCVVADDRHNRLYVGGGDAGESGVLCAFDPVLGSLVQTRELHADLVMAVAISPDGKYSLTGAWDQTIGLVDLQTNEARGVGGHTGAINGVAWVDERVFVTGSDDHTLRVWAVADTRVTGVHEQHTNGIVGLMACRSATNGDAAIPSTVVSIGRDRTVRLWWPGIGRMVRFVRLDSQPKCLHFLGSSLDGGGHAAADVGPKQSQSHLLLVGDDAGRILEIDLERASIISCQNVSPNDWIESIYWNEDHGIGFVGGSSGKIFQFFRENGSGVIANESASSGK